VTLLSRLEIFYQVIPREQIDLMIELTNNNLAGARVKSITEGELIKFLGLVVLATRFEFGARRELWSQTKKTKYEDAPAFGRTGMPRNRFDQIWSALSFSRQTNPKPPTMSWEEHRWQRIDNFVSNFNSHRATKYYPSDRICVDESISRWYGLGGSWIDIGLPTYVAMDRKPENGCEIQNCCDGKSGIMLQLRVVKSVTDENEDEDDGINHGTKILLDLVKPWWNKVRHVICADSYFSSVQTTIMCKTKGLEYVGVVKTATRSYPMHYLTRVPLSDRGKHHAVVHKTNGLLDMVAFVWVDRERRYFITNSSSLEPGTIIERQRWRQLDNPDGGAARMTTFTDQPKCVELYYSSCAMIDRHNRCRQDTLGIEKKLGTLDWDKRVNLSILSMCIVDAWLTWRHLQDAMRGEVEVEDQGTFYSCLAEEMIDNNIDSHARRNRRSSESDGPLQNNFLSPTLIKTSRVKRRTVEGEKVSTSHTQQGYCKVCNRKVTTVCSGCLQTTGKEVFFCNHVNTNRNCFLQHKIDEHN